MPEGKPSQLQMFQMFGVNEDSQEHVKVAYAQFKCLVKKLQTSSTCFSRISKSYADITQQLTYLVKQLSQEDCPEISERASHAFSEIMSLANTKISETLNEQSSRINSFLGMYSALMKKKYEKFLESHENVMHYREKMEDLSKGHQDSHRYERNKNKLDSAEEDFNENLLLYSKNLQNVSSEGSRMLSDCYASTLNTMAVQYHRFETEFVAMIDSQEDSAKLSKFASFFGGMEQTSASETFEQKTKRFFNKNLSKQHQQIKIKLSKYFDALQKLEAKSGTKKNFDSFKSVMSEKKSSIRLKNTVELKPPKKVESTYNSLSLLDI